MLQIPAFLMTAAARVGIKILDKKGWLPADYYHRLSVQKLKSGDLDAAVSLNKIALAKSPDHKKALVIFDVIQMRNDTRLSEILLEIESTQAQMNQVEQESFRLKKSLDKMNMLARLRKTYAIFPLLIFLFIYIILKLIGITFEIKNNFWLFPFVAVLFIVLYYISDIRKRDDWFDRFRAEKEKVMAELFDLNLKKQALRQQLIKLSGKRDRLTD